MTLYDAKTSMDQVISKVRSFSHIKGAFLPMKHAGFSMAFLTFIHDNAENELVISLSQTYRPQRLTSLPDNCFHLVKL